MGEAQVYKILFSEGYSSVKEVDLKADSVTTDDMGRLSFKNGGQIIGVFKWEFVKAYYLKE
jgi:hypothetical protein